jgi:Toxin PAAR-like domain
MANQVYANGMEVSCKAGDGKSICAFPDVCFTPPQTPATPPGVPIPYPNTGIDLDCADGSTSVKVSGQEVMLKNKSYFKKSTGDEAGCAPKKGLVNSKISGKVYFTAWSMDVMIEGENAVRHLDVTTHNHGSTQNEFAPWPRVSRARPGKDHTTKPCEEACKRKRVSTKKKDDLRRTDEYKAAMKQVNPPPPPNKCTTCKNMFPKLSPDHMLPLDHIRKMPGFACLSDEDQSKIANHKDNMVGLCGSCNTSKKDKIWPAWKGVKVQDLVFKQKLLDVSEKRTQRIEKNTQTRINNAPCK